MKKLGVRKIVLTIWSSPKLRSGNQICLISLPMLIPLNYSPLWSHRTCIWLAKVFSAHISIGRLNGCIKSQNRKQNPYPFTLFLTWISQTQYRVWTYTLSLVPESSKCLPCNIISVTFIIHCVRERKRERRRERVCVVFVFVCVCVWSWRRTLQCFFVFPIVPHIELGHNKYGWIIG